MNLGAVINSPSHEIWPYVAPDESSLIFETQSQMWISFRNPDGSWAPPANLSQRLFDESSQDHMARLSPDGKVLFFVSNRWLGNRYFDRPLSLDEIKNKAQELNNGLGNVFWVDASIIEEIRPD